MSTHIGRFISTHWLRLLTALAITLASVFLIQTVYGQTETSTDPLDSVIPRITTQSVKVTPSTPTSIAGSFTAFNAENRYIGNLTYQYIILGPRPAFDGVTLTEDDAPVYAEIPSNEEFSLTPNEKKDIPFTLTSLPELPRGEYRLRIEIRTQEGRVSSWADATTVLGEEVLGFGVFEGGLVTVDSVDPATQEEASAWDPNEGVNVDPNQEISYDFTIRNAGTATLNGTVRVATQKLLMADASPTITSGPTVSIEPGQTIEVSVPFTTASEPGAYASEITIVDTEGATRSNTSTFRTVVRGASASILRTTLDSPATKAGETVKASFSIIGSADRETTLDGSVEVEVLSGQTSIGKESLSVPLTDIPTVANAVIQLTGDVTETLGLRVTVRDANGQVLASSTTSFSDVPVITNTEATQSQTPISALAIRIAIGATIVVLILIIILAWRSYRSRGDDTLSPPPGTTGVLLLMAGVIMAGILLVTGMSATTKAQDTPTRIYRDATGIYIIRSLVNCPPAAPDCQIDYRRRMITNVTPLQDAAYRSEIVYDIRLEWYACANKVQSGELVVRTLQGGGKQIESVAQANNQEWRQLARRAASGSQLGKIGGKYATYWIAVFGTVKYPGPFPNHLTTLWTHGLEDDRYTRRFTHDDFRWITFEAPEATGSDVSITKQGSAGASIGGLANYTINVENHGPETATDIVVTDPIPSGVTFNALSSSPACSQVGSNIVCTIDSLAPTATTLLGITFNVPDDGSLACGTTISNSASVTSSSADPDSGNNTTEAVQTTISCGACADGIDNDGDGLIDADDPACHEGYDINQPYDPTRPSENDTQCTDAADNDDDGLIDEADPGCHEDGTLDTPFVPSHDDESNAPTFDPGVIIEDD